jgi:hypothetical protein
MFTERFNAEARPQPFTVSKHHLPEDALFLQFSGGGDDGKASHRAGAILTRFSL